MDRCFVVRVSDEGQPWEGVAALPGALSDVARILRMMAELPNARNAPLPGDVPGDERGPYEQWFDGGAMRGITGGPTYWWFVDGARATSVMLHLGIEITLPDGRRVSVQREPSITPLASRST